MVNIVNVKHSSANILSYDLPKIRNETFCGKLSFNPDRSLNICNSLNINAFKN